MTSDGIQHNIAITEGSETEFLCKSEFEVVQIIEKWRLTENIRCEFCNSINVEILDVFVDGKKLYDYDRFVSELTFQNDWSADEHYMFMLDVNKLGNQIKIKPAGKEMFVTKVLRYALTKIIDSVKQRPNQLFSTHENGSFFICVTGKYDFKNCEHTIRVECFKNAGLAKIEILDSIMSFADKVNASRDYYYEL